MKKRKTYRIPEIFLTATLHQMRPILYNPNIPPLHKPLTPIAPYPLQHNSIFDFFSRFTREKLFLLTSVCQQILFNNQGWFIRMKIT